MRASSAGGGVPSGGRGAGRRVRRWVTARGAAARGRGLTSRSLESRGLRDVTGAVFRLTVRKPKRNATEGDRGARGAGLRGLYTRGNGPSRESSDAEPEAGVRPRRRGCREAAEEPASGYIKGVRKRRNASS
ncbi:hypothetical protein GCM10023335_91470 [Streptomyces siamensis]|uniref:Uncharacterized protein n=1 Tax=Streptomyces siamensis TaxID=1274986 RepID=A0ABP9JSE7_9ACTN